MNDWLALILAVLFAVNARLHWKDDRPVLAVCGAVPAALIATKAVIG